MRKIILDGSFMKTKEISHMYLKEKLSVCGYYGDNLDALYDAISTITEAIEIEFINVEVLIDYLEEYGKNIIAVFEDASYENINISFKMVDK